MIIKESFADCSMCDLLNSKSSIAESNCKRLEDVDVVFIVESPSKDDITSEPPKILSSDYGQVFKKYFELYNLSKCNYLITHMVLCNSTKQLNEETIDRCKINCFKLIDKCKPKLIVLLGSNPAKGFGLMPENTNIASIRGKIFKWKNIDTFITYHPVYVFKTKSNAENIFKKDMEFIANRLNISTGKNNYEKNVDVQKEGAFYYKIPEKFYTKDYYLLDVQQLFKSKQIVYIFKDKSGKKVYHFESDDYSYYTLPKGKKHAPYLPFNELIQESVPYSEKKNIELDNAYEADVKLTNKHSSDYYIFNKDEENMKLRVMFLDIETYTTKLSYSTVEDAEDFIALIGFRLDGVDMVYTVNPRYFDIDKDVTDPDAIVYDTEVEMLLAFAEKLKELDPDLLVGWNSNGFDIPYIVNRMRVLGLDPALLSRFGELFINPEIDYFNIAGYILVDMLAVYKKYVPKRETYRLGYIANVELGDSKTGSGDKFSQMYRDDPDNAIRYNKKDFFLLERLNDKLKHLDLLNEIRRTCGCDFTSTKSQMPQLDTYINAHLKKKGFAVQCKRDVLKTEKFKGAFVKEPEPGIHEYIVDLDAKSLYPSIILTYNIGVNTLAIKFENPEDGFNMVHNKDLIPEKVNVIFDPYNEAVKQTISKSDLFSIIETNNMCYTSTGCIFKSPDVEKSIYSEVIEPLLSGRDVYKNLKKQAQRDKNDDLTILYDTKQLVMKVLANSIYGILGNNNYRFFNVDLAKAITLSGQELTKTSIFNSDIIIEGIKKDKTFDVIPMTYEEFMSDTLHRKISNITTSDTDSLFLCYGPILKKMKISDDEKMVYVRKWTEDIQNKINDEIIMELIKKHNVDKKYNQLYFKNEFIMKRGLFQSKKHYATYNVEQEGVPRDEIDTKGIEIKRSDFPSATKDKLSELLEMILKSENISINKIMNYIDETEEYFVKLIREGSQVIARPMAFSKKEEDYIVITQAVRGMTNFNTLEYRVFQQGSRGYKFDLNGIDYTKAPDDVIKRYEEHFVKEGKVLNLIVIPDDMEYLPDYYIVDLQKMLEFSWIERWKGMLGTIIEKDIKSTMMSF